MSSAKVASDGTVTQLDGKPDPDERITEESVKDNKLLARFLLRLFREIAVLKRRFWPQRMDFEDHAFDNTGTVTHSFQHNFSGRVRWWIVDWGGGAGAGPGHEKHANTSDNTLVLVSYVTGTGTLRVEESG